MSRHRLSINRIYVLVALLAAMALLAGWLWAQGYRALVFLVFLVVLVSAWKLAGIYRRFVRNLDFIFNAVRNNDYSFRFADKSGRMGSSVIGYSLNRVKEVLDEAKVKNSEKERYYETIIECANIGIVLLMDNGLVVKSNSRALELLGVPLLSHIDRLRPLSQELADTMKVITPSQQCSVNCLTESGDVSLLLSCSSMEYSGCMLRVVTIENINRELDTQEGLAWEKLTRILTHEIMNSLAPVTSISNTLLHNCDDVEMVQQGLETIHSTSDRLMSFVDSFRSVTRIPPPQKSPFYLAELVKEVLLLVETENIETKVDISPVDTMLYADRGQLSQVVLNLLKNAVEACLKYDGEKLVEVISTIESDEKIRISIINSGDAIPADVVENIFTPFFTTKQDGSGIGLAVSKQIMRLHGGTLRLSHNSNGRVAFEIVME